MSEGWHDYAAASAARVGELEAEIERLRAHIRAQAEDIIALGQMVGRCCPVCDRRALEGK